MGTRPAGGRVTAASMGKTRQTTSPSRVEAWNRVRQHGLSVEAVRMAREMRLNPRTLLGNMASVRDERWKAPSEEWVRDLYAKRQRRSRRAPTSDGAAEK